MDITLFLRVLSVTAIFTTIALFFCGIPICINIWRRKSTFEISGMPFLMGALGGTFWLRYGWLKWDLTMVTVNAVGVTLFNIYLIFYFVFTKEKCAFGAKYIAVQSMCGAMMVLVHFYGIDALDYLGLACMTFNIINFGAPLAGLGVVLRKRCCDTLPLPMCVANLLVSFQWFLYGNIVRDFYVMLPNGCGLILAVLQLSLFIVFPLQSEGVSLLSRLLGKAGDGKVGQCDAETAEAIKHTAFVGHIWRKMSDTTKNFMMPRARSGSFDSCSTPGTTMSSTCESESAVATPTKCHRTLSAPDISSLKRRTSETSKDADC